MRNRGDIEKNGHLMTTPFNGHLDKWSDVSFQRTMDNYTVILKNVK